MSIEIIMRPVDEPLSWEAFCKASPPFSIAVDGYVGEGPRYDPVGPRLNLNHHEGVDRLATRATCAQALIKVRMGLFERFRTVDGPRALLFCNDCDEDVTTSCFVLAHNDLSRSTANPALNRLVGLVDALDTTAGAYPYVPDMRALQELAWIFQPYRKFRVSGGLDRRRDDEFEGVATDVMHRMMEYVTGRGQRIPLDTRYTRIGGGPGWTMIHELGENGRVGAFGDGIKAYVVVRDRGGGRYTYTVGRVSGFIPFPVPELLAALDAAEGDPERHWGGGDTIGGSPRATGSRLAPSEVEKLINDHLRTLA